MIDRTLGRIFILIGLALLAWLLFILKPVVIPFVAAFFIAYFFSGIVNKLARIGLPRWLSTTLVFVGIGIGLVLAVWYIIPLAWKQIVYARDSIPGVIYWVNHTALPWITHTFKLEPMAINANQISDTLMQYIQTNYSVDSIQSLLLRLAQSGLNFIQLGGTVVLIPIISFYFLLDWNRMLKQMHRLIPRPYEKLTLQIVSECHVVLRAFVKGQFLVMILLGTVYAVGLQLIGLEVGLIIGMVAGLASIIPYLGFAVGIISAVAATFFQFGLDWMQLLLVGVVFMIGQAIEGYILQPFLLGDKIGLSPVAVVFAVLAGAQLGGILGMLIALPVAAVIVVLLKHIRDFYENSNLYGEQYELNESDDSQTVTVQSEHLDVDIHVKTSEKPKQSADQDEK
ncbi:chloramphenicol efflux transporter CxpE [Acinetobacter rathckeae]|uniref:chloramphenicol efflux transporter CxpE n=1 Tax=Acinetobacter rathckeae TaxID=2605272 RepID=UPI0018A2B452|nr:AI-2E family transporter [Acinetobacter rathckeae]MBF7687508.1 AI-2E family transporter [Acinetobacter rathckeae]